MVSSSLARTVTGDPLLPSFSVETAAIEEWKGITPSSTFIIQVRDSFSCELTACRTTYVGRNMHAFVSSSCLFSILVHLLDSGPYDDFSGVHEAVSGDPPATGHRGLGGSGCWNGIRPLNPATTWCMLYLPVVRSKCIVPASCRVFR